MRGLALALIASLLIAAPAATRADPPAAGARPFRILAIAYRGRTDVERGFADYLAERHIPVEIDYRDLALDTKRLPGLVDEIRRTRPDLILTWGTPVTLGIAGPWDRTDPQRHILDIPIVFAVVAAPVSAHIVPDLRSSGRNLTGVSHVAAIAIQIQAMSAYRPFHSLGTIYTPTEPNSQAVLEELRALGRRQGFAVQARPFRIDSAGRASADDARALIQGIKRAGAQWLYLPPDSFLTQQARASVLPAALDAGLPTFASTEALMSAGALAGLVSRYYTVGQFAAYKAEQILVGKVQPRRIPVETLSRFSLQIDLRVARRLNLLPPLGMLNYAEILGADGDCTGAVESLGPDCRAGAAQRRGAPPGTVRVPQTSGP
jgi:putative tryptophan/tyrosine transport system substrate-binding protein